MVNYSAQMEPLAARMLIHEIYQYVTIRTFTSDRSTLMKKLFEELNKLLRDASRPEINHTFDVWHFVKSVTRDLWSASKLASCPSLKSWSPSVQNAMWWCFEHCDGSPEKLTEMMLSIPEHVANIHSFPENGSFKSCAHSPLDDRDHKPWLKKDSLSWKKLVMAIRGKRDLRLKDLQMMTSFTHTGINESLNSHHNKYFTKEIHFGHAQAMVRGAITCIDHNYNVNREQARTKAGELRYNIVNSRDGLVWSAKPIPVDKDESWKGEIMTNVLDAVASGVLPKVEIPTHENYKKQKKKAEKPDKTAAVALHRSRFQSKR